MKVLSHYEKLKIIYPSMTSEEYEKWIQSGIRAERVAKFKIPRYYSPEQLRFAAEGRVSQMVWQLKEAEKVLKRRGEIK